MWKMAAAALKPTVWVQIVVSLVASMLVKGNRKNGQPSGSKITRVPIFGPPLQYEFWKSDSNVFAREIPTG